jgi:hypothetical protein
MTHSIMRRSMLAGGCKDLCYVEVSIGGVCVI